jgi:hypothetical protein
MTPAPEMTQADAFVSKKLRLAGILIVLGLSVEGLSLVWNHPLSFIAFLGVGGLMIFVGIAIYLIALASPQHSQG